MKNAWLYLFSALMGAILLCLGAMGGWLIASSYPTPEPERVVEVVTVEVPQPYEVEKVVTVEVPVEVLVTPTPGEIVQLPAPTEAPTPEPTEAVVAASCYDAAWVVTQPRSDLQAGALERGNGKRLTFRIRNEGTCIWDGYVLSSDGVFEDIPIPLTYPGEIADFYHDFIVYDPMEARFYILPPTAEGALLLGNSASPGDGLETMYYRLDVKLPAWRGVGGASYVCDSKG